MMRFIKDVNAECERRILHSLIRLVFRFVAVLSSKELRVEFGILVRPNGRKDNLYKLTINDKVISY